MAKVEFWRYTISHPLQKALIMDEKKSPPHEPRYKAPPLDKLKEKEQRLALALRENLKKRKEQRRLRKEVSPAPSETER